MRNYSLLLGAAVLLVIIVAASPAIAQTPPDNGKPPKVAKVQSAFDLDKEILKEIKESYKAQYEVHEDVLSELRKQYEQPTTKREDKIFSELRRLYQMTDRQESAIRQELQRAYESPSKSSEERLFREIEKSEKIRAGAVRSSVQQDQARKTFQKLDRNGDGTLAGDEIPEALGSQILRWDRNRDNKIDADEYWGYYQGRLTSLSEQVATGQIDLKMSRGGPDLQPSQMRGAEVPPAALRGGTLPAGLPDWFIKLDTNRDGQVGLYEWVQAGRPPQEFKLWDRNDDGFITVEEAIAFVTRQAAKGSGGQPPS